MQLQVKVLVFFATLGTILATNLPINCLTEWYAHLERLAYGFDLTTVDFNPLNHTSDELLPMPPYSPLFEFTCTNASNVWTNWNAQLVHFPDQVHSVQFYNDTTLKLIGEKTSYTSTKAYLASVIEQIDNGPNEDGVAVLSFRFRNGQKHLLSGRSMVRLILDTLNMTVILGPETSLMPSIQFLNFTANMTGLRYQENTEAFQNLLATFGTHWFEKLDFGQQFYTELAIDDYYYKQVGANKITEVLIPFLKEFLYKKVPKPQGPDFYAARPEMLFGQYGKLPHQMWLIGATRPKSISNLLTDKPLKDEVQLAIDVKLAKAYLKSAKYSMQLIEDNEEISWLLMGHFTVANMVARIDTAIEEVVPVEAVLEQIQKEAEDFIFFAENCKVVA